MKPYYRVYSEESIAAEHAETLDDAQVRAEFLAAKHPGRAFEILRCVGYASTSKASTFWMDGEEPPESIPKLPVGAIGYCHYGNGQTAFCVAPEKPRWREMERGETFQDGDQFFFMDDWRAVPNSSFGLKFDESYNHPHRRPL